MAIRAKDVKWLKQAADPGLRMYPGIKVKDLPEGPKYRLLNAGLIESYSPHNPVHDMRFTATDKGLMVIRAPPPSHGGDGRG